MFIICLVVNITTICVNVCHTCFQMNSLCQKNMPDCRLKTISHESQNKIVPFAHVSRHPFPSAYRKLPGAEGFFENQECVPVSGLVLLCQYVLLIICQ